MKVRVLRGYLALGIALLSFASINTFAKLSQEPDQAAAQKSEVIDPNNVVAYSNLVVRCFTHSMIGGQGKGIHHIVNSNAIPGGPKGMLEHCRSIFKTGSRLTPDQFAAIRKNLIESHKTETDSKRKEAVQNALFQVNEWEQQSKHSAELGGEPARTFN